MSQSISAQDKDQDGGELIGHQTLALAFANALSFFLREGEGIVAQGETWDHKIHKFLVHKSESKIRVSLDDTGKPVGSLFWMHDTPEDTILGAALDGGEFIV